MQLIKDTKATPTPTAPDEPVGSLEAARRVLTFEQSRLDPWLWQDRRQDDSAKLANLHDDQRQLEANCKSLRFVRLVRLIELLLELQSLQLVATTTNTAGPNSDPQPGEQQALRNRLVSGCAGISSSSEQSDSIKRLSSSSTKLAANRRRIKSALMLLTITVCSSYLFGKLLVGGYLMYEYDKLSSDVKVKLELRMMAPTPSRNSSKSTPSDSLLFDAVDNRNQSCQDRAQIFSLLTNGGGGGVYDNSSDKLYDLSNNHSPMDGRRQFAQLTRLNQLLDQFGFQYRTFAGVGLISYSFIGFAMVAFYLTTLVKFNIVQAAGIRVDFMAFLCQPNEELARLTGEINLIVDEIINSIWTLDAHSGGGHAKRSRREQSRLSSTGSPSYKCGRRRRTGDSSGGDKRREIVPTRQLCQVRFLELVIRLRNLRLFKPIVVSARWHSSVVSFAWFLALVFLSISFGMSFLSHLLLAAIELYERTKQRLYFFDCAYSTNQGGGTNETASSPPPGTNGWQLILQHYLNLPPLSRADQLVYADAKQSYHNPSIVQLLLHVELGHYFTGNFVQTELEATLSMGLLAVWSTVSTLVFVLAYIQKVAWLVQIKRQLADCISLAASLQLAAASATGTHGGLPAAPAVRRMELELASQLTISFVNYELYRRQHRHLGQMADFLVWQAGTFVGLAALVCYLLTTSLVTTFKLPIIFATFWAFSFMNIYLLVSAYGVKLNEQIHLNVVRLLAQLAAERPRGTANIVQQHRLDDCTTTTTAKSCPPPPLPLLLLAGPKQLWRRQLMGEPEVRRFAACRLLGVHMTYQKLVAFNAYLAGFWLIVGKLQQQQQAAAKSE